MSSPSRMSFDFSFAKGGGRGGPRDDEEPLRLLVIADLGGSRSQAFAQRKPVMLDVDNFDAAFRRIGPSLSAELDGLPVALSFESLDDFHPDRLFARLAPFEALRKLRGELADPAQFRRAAAALGLSAGTPAPVPGAAAAADGATDVERLLGRKAGPGAAATDPKSLLDHWLRDAMAPHVVPSVAHEQKPLLAAADEALSAQMRGVLHHPQVQALEAAWRGIDRLVRELDLGESLQLFVLDASRADLEADVAAHRGDLSGSHLHRLLCPGDSTDARRWGLLVLDQVFTPDAQSVQLLAALGALASRAGAPLLAGAAPQAAGAAALAQLAEPRRWQPDDAPELGAWTALRTSPMAPWLGLVAPRVLLRLPYGAATDRIDSFAFEEMPASRDHAAYLWGNGALALALLAGRAFLEEGWSFDPDSQLQLDDLPSHVYTEDGARHQQPCAELLLSESAAQALLGRGVMPLMSWRDRNAVRLMRWQSLADPPRALQGLSG